MTENATPHTAPTIVAGELPDGVLAAGRYDGDRLVRVVHQPYLAESTVAVLVGQLVGGR
jgi:hypothetical protein